MENSTNKAVRTIAVVPNIEKPNVPVVALELAQWLGERSVRVIMKDEDAIKLDRSDLGVDESAFRQSDIVVCLGGDGTILRGVRLLRGAAVPVIGVNLGRVGFLSEVELNEMYPAMERIIAGDFMLDERMMLQCVLKAGDYQLEYLALNELAIERGRFQHMIEIDTYINEEFFSRYTSDGLIFATPTGSTAFSFSAGGPIVSPGQELILLAPINPHSLFGRTLVLGSTDTIRIELGKKVEVQVGVDGFAVFNSIIDEITIAKAPQKAILARLKERSFYTLFKDKLRVWDTWLR
ncbi:MAG TPA: NAD(+)/NADH kinase [Candidatus Aquicultor sp.]|jgi:NAD+ kinase